MKQFLTFLALLITVLSSFAATSYTSFYCVNGGSNLNSGSSTSTTALFTSVNANWDATTGIFTPVDGSTPASTVTVGMWASVYLDAATVAVYVGRITAVGAGVNGAITVSLTANAGTAPTTGATGRTIKVEGGWLGPSSIDFPFDFATLRLTNAAGDRPKIYFKNDKEYNISQTLTHSLVGPISWEGYATTPGDNGMAVINGNGVGSAIILLTISGNLNDISNFIFRSNGTSSSASGFVHSGANSNIRRVVTSHSRGTGLFNQGLNVVVECTAFSNNISNTALEAGMRNSGAGATFIRCLSNTNGAANAAGIHLSATTTLDECIFASNGTNGITLAGGASGAFIVKNCDLWRNGGHGLEWKQTAADTGLLYVENCNFFLNALWGLQSLPAGSNHVGAILNCAFGAGTMANASGTITTTGWGSVNVLDTTFITYTANSNPWANPDTGDFRIRNAQGWHVGRGTFMQTQAGYTGTVGYPDIGAAFHLGVTNAVASVFSQ